jgi:hypothetical protein
MLAALRLSRATRRGLPALESCRAAASSRGLAAGRTRPPEPRELPRTIAPLPPIPDPPEGSMLHRIPQKEYKTSSRSLVQARAFLGFNRRATHPASYRYLLGRVGGGHAIIDPDETLWAMRKVMACLESVDPNPGPSPDPGPDSGPDPDQVMAFLKKVAFRGGRILFVSTDPTLARLTRVVGEQTGQLHLSLNRTLALTLTLPQRSHPRPCPSPQPLPSPPPHLTPTPPPPHPNPIPTSPHPHPTPTLMPTPTPTPPPT